MVLALSNEDKVFISEHLNSDVTKLVLKTIPDKRWLITQIISRKKAVKKLPNWYKNLDLLFPQPLSVEQSSSEITAKYKSELTNGHTLIDTTGGMGIDSAYFAQQVDNLIYIEQNTELAQITQFNFEVLGLNNTLVVNEDSISFLKNYPKKADWIYIDPARRSAEQQRVSKFSDCEPDITKILPLLFEKATKILVKASPLLDIQQAFRELSNIKAIHVVAVENDCKELLFELDSQLENIDAVKIYAINLPNQTFTFNISDEQNAVIPFSNPLNYLYEPNSAVLKAGAFKSVAQQYGLFKIAPHSHLYTSEQLVPDFCGRTFEILAITKVEAKALKPCLEDNKANITTRNFPMGVEELRKKLKLKDGGDVYLLATTFMNGDKRIIVCKKNQL